ncbi:helix-turn-helix transcriptional regulator [Actinoplanes sp. HUAS TT8]|uniref:helix-turn-helix transcriptional regulator n=1 Tax=Actinoplanes sp. HUAS TT8 TaxID=3447453 RepID=UPI003F52159E
MTTPAFGGPPRLVGAREIGERLVVSRQRIQQLADRADFPEPFQELRMGRVWWATDVEAWIRWWRSGTRSAYQPPTVNDEETFRRLAERIADTLGERGVAFVEDEQIPMLSGLVRLLISASGISRCDGRAW